MSQHIHVYMTEDGNVIGVRDDDGEVVELRDGDEPGPQHRDPARRRCVGDSLPFDYAETREARETREAVRDAAPTMAERLRALSKRYREFWGEQ